MKRLWINFKYFFAAWILITFASFAAGKIIQFLNQPKQSVNITAYEHLIASAQASEFSQAKIHADYAQQVSTDPEIKTLADLISRGSALALEKGHKTKAETSTLAGMVKDFLAGYNNPIIGLKDLGFLYDKFVNDPDKIAETIDARYAPYYRQMDSARRSAVTTFWIFFILLWALAFYARKTLLGHLVPHLYGNARPPVSNTSQSEPEKNKVEEPTITCPNCQARNRNRILSSGQKLVCGQCKTVLLSVS